MFTSKVGGFYISLYKAKGKPEWIVSSSILSSSPFFGSATFKAKNANDAKAKAWGIVMDTIESKVAEMRREVEG